MQQVLTRVDRSKVFAIVYSDDTLFGATCPIELKRAIELMEK